MSNASEHWICCDADTYPRLDTCPYPNGDHWTEAQPKKKNYLPKICFSILGKILFFFTMIKFLILNHIYFKYNFLFIYE